MSVDQLTVSCEDVRTGVVFFRDILGLPVRRRDPEHAEVDLGHTTATITSTPAHAGRRNAGVIVEVEVPDVRSALQELRTRGVTVLLERVITDWGTEAAYIAGPDGVVVELYRPLGG